ncbi:MAG: cytochrome c biogenesis heme-transporting ATPase CcmA [Halieaceae bacterium]|nr:cytochrome c biogenesis heme-transporting ATPase CcmA [Halieaceae bacterium]
MTALIQTVDLCCERDERLLVDRLNLSLEQGQVLQLEGPNGSGKTTLLRVLCGLSQYYRGELLWGGLAARDNRCAFFNELLYLGHSAGVKSVLSPRENLHWFARAKGLDGGAEIESALQKVGLYGYEDSPCYTLSAGQQRRVGLARLFLGFSPLWVLDEPFTAIDKAGVAELEAWIQQHAERGGSAILTTHHPLDSIEKLQRLTLGGQG